jgi:hypothetical protein
MSNNKKSSVEWLNDELASLNFDYLTGQIGNKEYNERHKQILEQAKAIHKEEIVESWSNGYDEEDRATSNPFKYYNETFGE